ncbi:MAG TPA: flagellin [Chthonomonadaceae bacterium]|nr:flagellin [Chthonomonadaceae bacterium]
MSFSFNTNLDALNALVNLQNVSNSISTSVQRLSSGLRINTPADDPSGFVISNALQAQVDGINQALTNTQSASNLVKTADGGLSAVNNLLENIRANVLDAANNVSLNPSAAQADQTAIQSALQAINNIASSTQFGSKTLLDGSAGVAASVTNSTLVGGINLNGAFGGGSVQAGNVTITVNNAATRAVVQGGALATYASVNASISTVNGGTTGTGGTVVINGQSVTVGGSDTVQTLINKINNLSASTGVSANFTFANASGSITLTQTTYGANYKISETESSALLAGTSGTSVVGANATVTVLASSLIGGSVSTATVTFVGGRSGSDSGLRVSDTNGNSILLTEAGNGTTTAQTVGQTSSAPLQFQIGANVGQTANLTLNSIATNNLGTTSVAGQTLATIDVTTSTGANNALSIVNEALNSVTQYRANLGSFQNNVLQSANNYLTTAAQNLTASISGIRDVNVAQEVLNLTNNQLIQQAGISALYTAKSEPDALLKLLQ